MYIINDKKRITIENLIFFVTITLRFSYNIEYKIIYHIRHEHV